MKYRILLFVLVPLLAGPVAYYAMTGELQKMCSSVLKLQPMIEYPSQLNLGDHEIGEQVVTRFTITNRGGGELVIDNIRTNCSCTGMEREQDGEFYRLESVRLKGGESADLVMRLSVRGVPPGAAQQSIVEFRCNDPTQPIGRIEVLVPRVFGGVSAMPASVVIGTFPVGQEVRHVVEVRDTANPPRRIERITTSSPDRIITRLMSPADQAVETTPNAAGNLIGLVEVIVDTQKPGDFNDTIQIHLAGETRLFDSIPVVGKAVAAVEAIPSLLVLPLTSTSGVTYSGKCVCRSTDGKPLTLAVESVPDGLTAEILSNQDSSSSQAVRIAWDPIRGKTLAIGQRRLIRLRAQVGENETVLDLPVICRHGEE